jgi:hypothetical protein
MLFFDLCLPYKHNKSVRFNNIIYVILIPSIYDHILYSIKTKLWYNEDDYKNFLFDKINNNDK